MELTAYEGEMMKVVAADTHRLRYMTHNVIK